MAYTCDLSDKDKILYQLVLPTLPGEIQEILNGDRIMGGGPPAPAPAPVVNTKSIFSYSPATHLLALTVVGGLIGMSAGSIHLFYYSPLALRFGTKLCTDGTDQIIGLLNAFLNPGLTCGARQAALDNLMKAVTISWVGAGIGELWSGGVAYKKILEWANTIEFKCKRSPPAAAGVGGARRKTHRKRRGSRRCRK